MTTIRTTTEIETRNLAIADFLGWVNPDQTYPLGYRVDVDESLWEYDMRWSEYLNGLAFDKEWSWIMLAWEKVATYYETPPNKSLDLQSAEIYGHRCRLEYSWAYSGIDKAYPERDNDTIDHWVTPERPLLECVFLAVSDFCQYWQTKQMRT